MEPKATKPANDIRVGFRTRGRDVIRYAERLLKEDNFKTLTFSAVGGSISTLVNVVEILKYTNPGLHQTNRMATISYRSVEETGSIAKERLYPKLEVILSLEKPATQGEGYQEPLTEEIRKQINETREKNRTERRRPPMRGRGFRRGGRGFRRGGRGFRGRGFGPRRPFRGGRGRPPMRRGGRPMTRGTRGAPRGRGRN